MTKFYICRHGQTINNKLGRAMGWLDSPLTDEGKSNAEHVAQKLQHIHFDALYSSDLGRAFITAYIIAQKIGYKHEIIASQKLRETSYGDLANLTYDDIEAKFHNFHNTDFIRPHGESIGQMKLRVIDFITVLSTDFPEKVILLVAHDGTINAIYSQISGEDLGDLMHHRFNAHDEVHSFEVHNGSFTTFE